MTYSISPNPASVNENAGTLTFTITRSPSSSAATVYASTVPDQGSNNNGDYTGITNQAVTFAAGQSQATVSVHIDDLGLTSGSETYRFIVQQNPTDPTTTYLATDNFTIHNTDVASTTYSISPNPASVNENAGTLTFTITRSNSSSAATVYASTVPDQGSNNNGDYTGITNQAVTFAAGQSQATVSVHIDDLGLTSGSETYRFIVQQNPTDPTTTYLATDNFTIHNTDVASTTYSISPNPASVNENAGTLTFTITRSNSSSAATVYASTVPDQGSNNNGDYTGITNQAVTFAAGQSQATVSVHIDDLGLTSGSETYRFIVQQNATDPTTTYLATDNFTINNTDVASTTYSISPNPASVNENAGTLTFTITRSSSSSAATVYASTVPDQGANNNGDYTGITNQVVTFAAGQSQATVSVHIDDLGLTSGSETYRFIVQQNPTDPTTTYLATDNFTINNTDVGSTTYSISPNPASVNENAGTLTFTITRSSSSLAATVYASTVPDQGSNNNGDYTGIVNQAVTFAAGQAQATVSVHIDDLGLTSGSETYRFIVQQNATDPTTTYLATDNFTIVNNDASSGGSSKQGIDFQNAASLTATQIAQKGYNFVVNYLGTSSSNYLTAAEANSDIAAGLQICSVYEVTVRNGVDYNPNMAANIPGYFADCLDNFGYTDGTNAYNYAHNVLNQPAGSAIYFAIDASAVSSSADMADVVNYFQGIQQAFDDLSGGNPAYKIGVYGGGDVLDTIYNDGLAQYKWLADAPSWSGSANYTNFTIMQFDNQDTTTFPGVAVDHDVTSGPNFGQWGAATTSTSSNPYDFNGDGSGDILLQNAGGEILFLNMAGGSYHNLVEFGNTPGWTIAGAGNITGDADADVVIQNASHQIAFGEMVNGNLANWKSVGTAAGFNVIGVGDINGDHFDDIVIQNPTTGEFGFANMANGVFNNWASIASTPGWKAVAVADVTDGGYDHVVIQNISTGEIGYANTNNGLLTGFVSLASASGYNVVGTGDINGSGDADVVIQNSTNGSIGYANMHNGILSNWVSLGSTPGWNVIAVENIQGNGFDNIVIQNQVSNQILYANMSGGSFQGWVPVTTVAGYTGLAATAPAGINAALAGVDVVSGAVTVASAGGTSDPPNGTSASGLIQNSQFGVLPTGTDQDVTPGSGGNSFATADNNVIQNQVSNQIVAGYTGLAATAPAGVTGGINAALAGVDVVSGAVNVASAGGTSDPPNGNSASGLIQNSQFGVLPTGTDQDVTPGSGGNSFVAADNNIVENQIAHPIMGGGSYQGWAPINTGAGYAGLEATAPAGIDVGINAALSAVDVVSGAVNVASVGGTSNPQNGISASWLTEGSQFAALATSTDQNVSLGLGSNSAVTADNLLYQKLAS